MGKLTSKGIHKVNVGNHPHIKMISKLAVERLGKYKCRILEMRLKLRGQKLNTTLYT